MSMRHGLHTPGTKQRGARKSDHGAKAFPVLTRNNVATANGVGARV
jgi:hypothetical protein